MSVGPCQPVAFPSFGGGDRCGPPPPHGVEVLRIEIEDRDPVILDVPVGTWTEHEDEDDMWATWDLGVVEVPGRQ